MANFFQKPRNGTRTAAATLTQREMGDPGIDVRGR